MGQTRVRVTLYFGFGLDSVLHKEQQADAYHFAEELASLQLVEAAGAYCADTTRINSVDIQVYSVESEGFRQYRRGQRVDTKDLRYFPWREPEYVFKATFSGTMLSPGIAIYPDGHEQTLTIREWRDNFADEVTLVYKDLCVALALASHGLIVTSTAIAIHRYRQTCERVRVESEGLLRYATERQWPAIKVLPLQQVVGWLTKYRLARQLGDTPVGRAVNALLNLDSSDGSYAGSAGHLFWAMLGLEALYARGNEKIQQQLEEKIQLFLGERVSFKKDLKQMYAIRSRFVHGSLGFPSIYYPYDASDEFEKFADTVYAASDQAEAVLIASLKELIERDWSSLEFATSVSVISPEPTQPFTTPAPS